MASRFTELVVDCSNPKLVAEFWRAVLEWDVTEEDEDGVYIESPERSDPGLLFQTVPEKKSIKNRLHIDVSPRDRTQEEEVERILALGAKRIDIGQGEVSWVVLADPEDNEFCVLKTRRP